MKRFFRGILMLGSVGAIYATAQARPADPTAPFDAATAFGARDNVLDVGISPDGKALVVLRPNGARGTVASVINLDGAPTLKPILLSDGNPQRLTSCNWATGDRIICSIYMIDSAYGQKMAASRMLAINSDGTGAKELSARSTERSVGIVLGGGDVIDWLGDQNDGSVLVTRWFLRDESTGHIISQDRDGLGVERVNTRTMARKLVEQPNPLATDYITDGHGNIRVMGIEQHNSVGESKDIVEYRYRKKDSRAWLPLDTVTFSNYHATGFLPYAVDPDLDVVYGLESVAGRTSAYSIALDGSLKKQLVFERPDADVDSLIEIGRQDRVVGAQWTTDKTHAAMFDPELKAFVANLSKALPGLPIVNVVDASADEQRLVLFAASDVDPGRFYLYDKPTKHLSEILPVRPQLAGTKLAAVKPISYPAADGTMVPAYLTLPPGSDGKNLPAIVLPHGGPSARDIWSFDWLPQYFANRGYAVIQPNYRGSTGYGQQWFENNGIRSWRTSIGDIDDAGRWLVKQGIADPAKLAIVGWSYGGYAALQSGATEPGLFKAVVAIAPVTDFGQIREKMELQHDSTKQSLDAVFGDSTTAQEGSPARHADRFEAPVMLFHGVVDQTVSVDQSRLMRNRLKDAGKSVNLIEYEGLDHQLDDSAARTDMLGKIDAFLHDTLG